MMLFQHLEKAANGQTLEAQLPIERQLTVDGPKWFWASSWRPLVGMTNPSSVDSTVMHTDFLRGWRR